MKRITLLIVICILSFNDVVAQFNGKQFTSDLFILDEYIKRQNKGIDFTETDTYTGTPYNHPSYLLGNVYRGNELLATDVALRYNAIADEMEIKESITSSDDDAKVLTKSPDIFVKIMDDIYVFVPYQGGVEGGGYFQVMFEGKKVDFFKKIVKDFTEAKKATSSITRDIPARFVDKPVYYLVTKEGKFYEFPNSRSKKMKVFGERKDEMKKYINEKRLDLNDEKDLKKAILYFDTL
tara:strand:- start:41994 stop:42704 length:711 start_codon:yes stop_codon:yes gene_type:complete